MVVTVSPELADSKPPSCPSRGETWGMVSVLDTAADMTASFKLRGIQDPA